MNTITNTPRELVLKMAAAARLVSDDRERQTEAEKVWNLSRRQIRRQELSGELTPIEVALRDACKSELGHRIDSGDPNTLFSALLPDLAGTVASDDDELEEWEEE